MSIHPPIILIFFYIYFIMIRNIFGIFLMLLHFLVIKKKKIKRLFTMTDWSFFILAASFIINRPEIYSLAITLAICSLIGKTVVLKKYTVQDSEDFVLHYLSVIIALILWYQMKCRGSQRTYGYLMIFLVFMFVSNHIYRKMMGKWIYRSVNLYTWEGNIKLFKQLGFVMATSYFI